MADTVGNKVVEVGEAGFMREVLETDRPVLVDFTAAWCAPCRAIDPAIEALAAAYEGRAKVVKVDVDANLETAERYGIRSMPTLLFFKGGKVVQQIVGAVPRARLEEAMQKVVA